MGQVAIGIIKALQCDSMWKYCCNAQHVKSRCCDDFCEVQYDTEAIEVTPSRSDIEVEGCCSWSMSK